MNKISMLKLKEMLDERNITMQKLSEDTGIPLSTITAWKKGECLPDDDETEKLASFLEVPVDCLLTENGDRKILNRRIALLLKGCTNYTDFANAVGEDETTIYHWIIGASLTCYNKIDEISRFFNVSVDFLLGRTNNPNKSLHEELLANTEFALWGQPEYITDEAIDDIITVAGYINTKRDEKNESDSAL